MCRLTETPVQKRIDLALLCHISHLNCFDPSCRHCWPKDKLQHTHPWPYVQSKKDGLCRIGKNCCWGKRSWRVFFLSPKKQANMGNRSGRCLPNRLEYRKRRYSTFRLARLCCYNFNKSRLPAELISCLIHRVSLASKEGLHPNTEKKLHR